MNRWTESDNDAAKCAIRPIPLEGTEQQTTYVAHAEVVTVEYCAWISVKLIVDFSMSMCTQCEGNLSTSLCSIMHSILKLQRTYHKLKVHIQMWYW